MSHEFYDITIIFFISLNFVQCIDNVLNFLTLRDTIKKNLIVFNGKNFLTLRENYGRKTG